MMKSIFFAFLLFISTLAHAEDTIVIFGATGDLTARKVMPALYNLHKDMTIVGVGRRDYSDEDFQKLMHDTAGIPDHWEKLHYQKIDFDHDTGYENLAQYKGKRVYYLATQPSYFPVIINQLHEHNLLTKDDKVVIEKPFGRDLASAIDLQKEITKHLEENQVYRIDHYLGKQGMDKLFSFRFKDGSWEPKWNHKQIDHIQITLSEEIGVGSRGRFWEETGLVRDIFQNHLLQLLTLVAMEPPKGDAIHLEKIKLLNAIQPIDKIVRGQYDGYRKEKGVAEDSSVETFAAAKLFIDNERWRGVPFYLRAGKRLPVQTTEIAVQFKDGQTLFIRIQPNPAIFLNSERLDESTGAAPEAYEKLLSDCLKGDKSHFVQTDEHLAAWRLFTPLLQQNETPRPYTAGTWPTIGDQLLQSDGRSWKLVN